MNGQYPQGFPQPQYQQPAPMAMPQMMPPGQLAYGQMPQGYQPQPMQPQQQPAMEQFTGIYLGAQFVSQGTGKTGKQWQKWKLTFANPAATSGMTTFNVFIPSRFSVPVEQLVPQSQYTVDYYRQEFMGPKGPGTRKNVRNITMAGQQSAGPSFQQPQMPQPQMPQQPQQMPAQAPPAPVQKMPIDQFVVGYKGQVPIDKWTLEHFSTSYLKTVMPEISTLFDALKVAFETYIMPVEEPPKEPLADEDDVVDVKE